MMSQELQDALQAQLHRSDYGRKRGPSRSRAQHLLEMRQAVEAGSAACEVCGRSATCVHHKNTDGHDHRRGNMMYVCRSCHRWLHGAINIGRMLERLERTA